MYYRLGNLKEQDAEVAKYLRPGQFVFLKFNSSKGSTEVYPVSRQKKIIGEIPGRVKEKYAEIRSYEPLKIRTNFEFELLSDLKKEELLRRELRFLQNEMNKISKTSTLQEKRRRRKYKIWASNISRKLIKIEVNRRGIESIYHFTSVDNLKSIINKGVISLDKLENQNIKYVYNDSIRLDNYTDSTSWCISHPNNFYLKDVMHKDPSKKLCIIEAKAEILWKKKCYFSETNAASNLVRYRLEAERVGVESFNEMFKQKVKNYFRQPHWHPKYPTDVQAEVLVFGDIELSDISGIYLYSNEQLKLVELENKNLCIPIKTGPSLFQYRKE